MPSLPPAEAPTSTAFVCDCPKHHRSACKELPFFKEHERKRYCVLHYPGKEKSKAFSEALKSKRDKADFDFQGVWFPDDVDFSGSIFTKPVDFAYAAFTGLADFSSSTFNEDASFSYAEFAKADFSSSTFGTASFRSASFSVLASFHSTTFRERVIFKNSTFGAVATSDPVAYPVAYFSSTTFAGPAFFEGATFRTTANFNSATFGREALFDSTTFGGAAYFQSVTFSAAADFKLTTFAAGAYFKFATFKDYAGLFGDREQTVFGNNSCLDLQFAKIEKPNYLSFHTLKLRPHWFINVDARKFDFTNVDWDWRHSDITQEIKSIEVEDALSAHRLLAIASRDLADNAEENHRYEEASRFRYMAMEARRLESWRRFSPLHLNWWYWLTSGYGESVWRALAMLIVVWLAMAALYTQVGFMRWEPRVSSEQEAAEARRDKVGEPLRGWRPLTYSLGVMTLQKPEPRPATDAAQAVVMLETILGPVQAALLALAIRRKFMR